MGTLSQFLALSSKRERGEVADRLQPSNAAVDQISNSILAVMVGASVELAEALTHMVNWLLDDPSVSRGLASDGDDEYILQGYVSEVLRIDPPVQGIYREVKSNGTVGTQFLRQKQSVFLNIANANLDKGTFSYPKTIDPTRSQEKVIEGDILTRTLGRPLLLKIMTQVLRAVLELTNIRRDPGPSGDFKRLSVSVGTTSIQRHLDHNMQFTPWTQSRVIQYDARSSAEEK